MEKIPASKYKDIYTFDQRKNMFETIQKKYFHLQANIPVIFQSSKKSKIYKHVPYTTLHLHPRLPVSVVRARIMKKLQVKSDQAFSLLIGRHILSPNKQVGELYNIYRQEDGFLYVTFIEDNPF